MDARIATGLNRFVAGDIEVFGDPREALETNEMVHKLAEDTSYQFSTFCVYLAVHSFNISVNNYGEAVTEGYSERGFDGIAIDLNGEPLPSPEYASISASSAISEYLEKKAEGEVPEIPRVNILMVQVKMKNRTEMSDLDHLGNSAYRFLANDDYPENLKPNKMVTKWWNIYNELRLAFQKAAVPFEPQLDLCFVYQGFRSEENLLNHAACNSSLQILSNCLDHDQVNFTIWRGDEIIDAIALAEQSVDGVLKEATLLRLPETTAEGFIGYVPAASIANMIPSVRFLGDNKQRPDERVFSDNIRSFTGDNKNNLGAVGLRRSLTDNEGDQIILRHNGITIVARDASLEGGLGEPADVTLKGYQIVNGAQSSCVLQRHLNLLEGVHIPVKIVVTEDEWVKDGVVVGANTQSQVSDYDMLARCPEVRAIQQGFQSVPAHRQDKLWLRRRRGERFAEKISDRFLIVTPRQLLEAFVAAIEGAPHSVHANSTKLITRVPSRVFCRNHHPSVYRAMGWLVTTGRRWAKANEYDWSDEDRMRDIDSGNSADNQGRRRVYRARHQFLCALWRLVDPNPEDVDANQGKLSHKLLPVEKRFEAVCRKLSDPDEAMALARKAADVIEQAADGQSDLADQVRKKSFSKQVKALTC